MKNKKIDEKTVRHVARLSRLSLNDNDVTSFSHQLSEIISYIDKLNQIDTNSVEATSHAVSDVRNVFREDKVRPSLSREEALGNAPRRIRDFFGVPKVIE